MHQHLVVCTLFIIALLWSSCQSEYNDHTELHLKGQVKALRVKRYKVQESAGTIIKKRLISQTLDKPQVYEYETLPPNCNVLFDQNGAITEMDIYNTTNELEAKLVYKDTVIELYLPTGEYVANVIMDHRWRPHYMNSYTKAGVLTNQVVVKYENKYSLSCTHREYSAEKELLEATEYSYDGPLLKYVKADVERSNYFHPRKQHRIEKIKYDAYDHPSEVTIDNGGVIKVVTIRYRLDEYNNWTEAMEYVNGEPERFVERVLTYYD